MHLPIVVLRIDLSTRAVLALPIENLDATLLTLVGRWLALAVSDLLLDDLFPLGCV